MIYLLRIRLMLIIFTVSLFFETAAFAGVIYFKNGNMLEGEIIKINQEEITIRYNFGLVSFPKTRIETIESSTEKESLLLGGKKRLTSEDLTTAPIVLPYFDTHDAEKKNKETLESSQEAISAVKLLKEKLDILLDKKKNQIQSEFDSKTDFYRKQLTTSRENIKDLEKEVALLTQTIQEQNTKLEDEKVINTDLKLKTEELAAQVEQLKADKLTLIDEKKIMLTEAANNLESTVKDLQTQHELEIEKLTKQFQHEKEVFEKMLAATTNEIAIAKKDKQYMLDKTAALEQTIKIKDESLETGNIKIEKLNREVDDLNKKIYVYQEKMDKQSVAHEEEKVVLFKSIVDEALREVKQEEELQLDKKNVPDKLEVEGKILSEKDKLSLIEYLRKEITFADNKITTLLSQISELTKRDEKNNELIKEHLLSIQKLKESFDTEKENSYNLRNNNKDLIKKHKKEIEQLKISLLDQSKQEKEKLIETFNQERASLKEIIEKTSAVFEIQAQKEAQIAKTKEMIDKTVSQGTTAKDPSKLIGEISELETKLGRIFLDLKEEVKESDTLYVIRDGKEFAKIIVMKYYPSFSGAIAKIVPQEDITKLKEKDQISK